MDTKDQKVAKHLKSLGYGKDGGKAVAKAAKAEKPEKAKKAKGTNRMTEEELTEDYPHVKSGSLSFIDAENKQAVRITCTTEGCEREREVRTSDLWQVDKCESCTRKDRRERARDRRKAKKADKAETPAETPAEAEEAQADKG